MTIAIIDIFILEKKINFQAEIYKEDTTKEVDNFTLDSVIRVREDFILNFNSFRMEIKINPVDIPKIKENKGVPDLANSRVGFILSVLKDIPCTDKVQKRSKGFSSMHEKIKVVAIQVVLDFQVDRVQVEEKD